MSRQSSFITRLVHNHWMTGPRSGYPTKRCKTLLPGKGVMNNSPVLSGLGFMMVCVAVLLSLAASIGDAAEENVRTIFGYIEYARIGLPQLEIKAKLDSGAETSSLDAHSITVYKEDGRRRVRFTVTNRSNGEEISFDEPLARHVRIKQHGGGIQRRPVVSMDICLGEDSRTVMVNLTDRSNFIYQLLLGRSALEGIALIDPALTFTKRPSCVAGIGDE